MQLTGPLTSPSIPRSPPNPFVEMALVYALTYLKLHRLVPVASICITILADTDYYSCPSPVVGSAPERRASQFMDFGLQLENVHKTGLGSSAALVAALIGSLISHHIPATRESIIEAFYRDRVHRLAQAAHCAAQGKVGSGFDIAAAVYGSCIYRRFSPSILENLGEPGRPGFQQRLGSLIDGDAQETGWDYEVQELDEKFASGLRLVMCDVNCGSSTRSMVKDVMAWRIRNQKEAAALWQELQAYTDDFVDCLGHASLPPEEQHEKLSQIIRNIRTKVRDMSTKSSVPIEPRSQTELLDSCSEISGVVGGLVPGAGGFDALAFLVDDQESVLASLREGVRKHCVRSSLGSVGVSPPVASLLAVRQENAGLRAEPRDKVLVWL